MLGLGLGLHNIKLISSLKAPENISIPIITGTAEVGSVLTVTNGTWKPDTGLTFTYQWQRGGVDISGATNNTYTLTIDDNETIITCIVTATNNQGSVSATSNSLFISNDWLLRDATWDDTGVWRDEAFWPYV